MIIDLHTHCNSGMKFDCPESNLHHRSFEFMMQDYKNCGILCGGFSFYSSVLSDKEIYQCNEVLSKKAQSDDRVYQWLVLDPRQEVLFDQISKMINEKKVLGIKIHSVYHHYDIEEYGDKIFSFANDLKCFVLMHPDKIPKMVKFADKYKDMNLIIAHLGSEDHVQAIKQAKHGNIFTDTSGGDVNLNNIIEYAVETVGAEKIFFGTDTYACGYQVGRMDYARISDNDREKIYYKNALNHFNISIKK